FDDVSACIAAAVRPDNFPKKMNFLDPAVLTRELRHAGLDVEVAAKSSSARFRPMPAATFGP
ncbi:MAG TPA: hypothetical protein VJ891_05675, partial [Casimicrobiaceae bacterium]|nr:hypothetical protein [Casimicrobiaceae bacterium]